MPVLIVVTLAAYLLLWQGYRVRSWVTSVGQVTLIIVLILNVALPAVARLNDAGVFAGVDQRWMILLLGLISLTKCLALYLFRASFLPEAARRHHAAARAIIGTAVVIGFMVTVIDAAIRSGLPVQDTLVPTGPLWLASYYLVSRIAYVTLLLPVAVWMIRASTGFGTHLKIGLRVASIGLLLMIMVSVTRALLTVVALLGWPEFAHIVDDVVRPGPVSAISAPLLFAGLSYPLVAARVQAFRRWRHQRAANRDLSQLWGSFILAFPELELSRSADRRGHGTRGPWRRTEFLHHRYIAESFDGLRLLDASAHDTTALDGRPTAAQVEVLRLLAARDACEQHHPGRLSGQDSAKAAGSDDHPVALLRELNTELQKLPAARETTSTTSV